MKSVAQKIFLTFGFITLIAMSVLPVYAHAQSGAPTYTGTPGGTTTIVDPLTAAKDGVVAVGGMAFSALAQSIITAAGPLLFFIMKILSGLLGITGVFLDKVIEITIVNMKENLDNLTVINDVWKTIRDFGNMSFIFILLYQGIKMVLGLGGSDIKKVISGIVMAAIFVNFSMFVTKIVIDASNIVTLGFYNSISSAGGGEAIVTVLGAQNFGFSGAFMKPLGLAGLWDTSGFNSMANGFGETSSAIMFLGGSIFLLVTLFAFLVISLLFVMRYMAFVLLLMMSPVAFLSLALPGLLPLSKKFWDTLMGQALFGPIYMIMTWITLTIAGSDGFLQQSTGGIGAALATPSKDSIGLIINFMILIGLIIYSVIQAKQWATSGGIVTSDYVGKGQAFLGGAVFGGASMVGRSTVGRLGQYLANNDTLKKSAADGGLASRLTLLAANKTATSSFDARNTKTVGLATKKMGSFGKGINTKGYKGYVDESLSEQKKKDEDRANQFKMSDLEKQKYKDLLDPNTEKGKIFADEEKKRKENELKQVDQQIKVDEHNLGIDLINEGIKDLKDAKIKAKEQEKNLNNSINNLEKDLTDPANQTQEKLANIKKDIEEQIKIREGIITTIDQTDAQIVANEKKLSDIKQTDKYKNTIKEKLDLKEKLSGGKWVSQDFVDAASMSGDGKLIKQAKDAGHKDVESEDSRRIKSYATRVAEKTGILSGIPNFRIDREYSKKRAANVRKMASVQKKDANLLKAIKEYQEEDGDKKEDKDKKDNSSSTANTATPPSTPPPAPKSTP
ncbi:MAG: zinc ribbon domain-containing protein [Minisyncoccota bacterium]